MSIRRIALFALPVLGLVLVGGAVATAAARGGPPMMFCHGDRDDHRAHAEFMVDRMLNKVDATDEQKDQIDGILDAAFDDFEALHEGKEEHKEQLKEVLGAETIDREALQELRAEALEHVDEASALFTDVIADVSEVLTAEQRQELIEMIEERHMK